MKTKNEARAKRKQSIRKRVTGTGERPRMTVFRSAKHIYVQVVDDLHGQTLAATSTLDKELRGQPGKKSERAKAVGMEVAKRCLSKGVQKVVFDRNGYLFHGRVKALADGARESGLSF